MVHQTVGNPSVTLAAAQCQHLPGAPGCVLALAEAAPATLLALLGGIWGAVGNLGGPTLSPKPPGTANPTWSPFPRLQQEGLQEPSPWERQPCAWLMTSS